MSTQPRWLGLQRTQPPEAHSSSGGGGFSTGHGAVSSDHVPEESQAGSGASEKTEGLSRQPSLGSDGARSARTGSVTASRAELAAVGSTAMHQRPQEAAQSSAQAPDMHSEAAAAGSEGSRGWWLPNLAAWLLPGGAVRPEQPAHSPGSDSEAAGKPREAARQMGGAGSAGSAASGQVTPGGRQPAQLPREPSQTPTDRRTSDSKIPTSPPLQSTDDSGSGV